MLLGEFCRAPPKFWPDVGQPSSAALGPIFAAHSVPDVGHVVGATSFEIGARTPPASEPRANRRDVGRLCFAHSVGQTSILGRVIRGPNETQQELSEAPLRVSAQHRGRGMGDGRERGRRGRRPCVAEASRGRWRRRAAAAARSCGARLPRTSRTGALSGGGGGPRRCVGQPLFRNRARSAAQGEGVRRVAPKEALPALGGATIGAADRSEAHPCVKISAPVAPAFPDPRARRPTLKRGNRSGQGPRSGLRGARPPGSLESARQS